MEDEVIKRTIPNNFDAEQAVIGSMIMSREAIIVAGGMLAKSDFYYSQNGILFEAITELADSGDPVDVITLQNRLKEKGVPPEVCSLEYVGEAVAAVPTSVNIEYYAKIVQEQAMLRRLLQAVEEIEKACYLGKEGADEIMEGAEQALFNLLQSKTVSDVVSMRELVVEALDRIENASKMPGGITGLPTGFKDLDYRLSGMQKGNLVLLAARPSMGKSAFALNIAQYVAQREDKHVAFFSLEMSREELVDRMLSTEAMVDSNSIRSGRLSDGDWKSLVRGAKVLGKSKMILDDTPSISAPELRSKCRRFKMEYDIQLVVVDYLQMMTGSRRAESRQQAVAEISRSLKQIARELDIPVLALSQLSREPEKRGKDYRPVLSDLRDSGAIEQDADVVMFLYRDDYYNKDSDERGVVEVNVAKQRNGPTGTVEMAWIPEFTKFANLLKDSKESKESKESK